MSRFVPRLHSISTRLAIWYALAATATLAALFVTGYFVLQQYIVNGLDRLNRAELGQVKAHLVRDYAPNDPAFLERRLRKPTDRSGALFYISLHNDVNGLEFRSENLHGRSLDGPPGATYNVVVAGVGSLRVGRFQVNPFTILIGVPDHEVAATLASYANIALALLAAMLVASLAIGFGLSRLALRPLRQIRETANRIHSDNLSARIPVGKRRDELADLSIMLNAMFERLESSFKQIRRFSAEASHELKTPLSLVRLHAEKMLLSGALNDAQEESVQLQLEELARLDQLIDEMLFLSRAEANAISLKLSRSNPAPFLHAFAQDARVLAEHTGVRFAHTHDGEGQVAFDHKRIRQVLLNVLSNALKVVPPGGHVTLRSLLEAGCWRISVEDEGSGLPAEYHERIFERFVRFPSAGKEDQGNGLGLAICRSIVGLHRGRIGAAPATHGSGLRVWIELPAPGV